MLEQYDEHRLGNSVAVAARIIYRLSKLVPDNMDRSGLFSFFSKELRASFHYDRFSIFLYDAERDFLTAFTAADGTVVEVFSDTRIAQNTVAWQAIQTRKPVVIKNLASLNWGGAVSLASVGLTATIALPLILNRQVIGTLHVSFVRQPDNLVEILNLLQTQPGPDDFFVRHPHRGTEGTHSGCRPRRAGLAVRDGGSLSAGKQPAGNQGHDEGHGLGAQGGEAAYPGAD